MNTGINTDKMCVSLEVYSQVLSSFQHQQKNGKIIREAIEIVLQNTFEDNGNSVKKDCKPLFQAGIKYLQDNPLEALSISYSSTLKESEVKRQYKNFALKYHPDKNEKLKPLFLVIKAAYDKLIETAIKSPIKPSPSDKKSSNAEKSRKNIFDYVQRHQKQEGSNSHDTNKYNNNLFHQRKEEEKNSNIFKEQDERAVKEAQKAFENISKKRKQNQNRNAREANDSKPFPTSTPDIRRQSQPSRFENIRLYKQATTSSHSHEQSNDSKSTFASNIGRVFTSNIRYNSLNSSNVTSNKSKSSNVPPQSIPKPENLHVIVIDNSTVEVSWINKSDYPNSQFELNWRNRGNSTVCGTFAWESSQKLVSGSKVRKKNLVAGVAYEFRLRCVIQLQDVASSSCDNLHLRSDWTHIYSIMMPLDVSPTIPKSSKHEFEEIDLDKLNIQKNTNSISAKYSFSKSAWSNSNDKVDIENHNVEFTTDAITSDDDVEDDIEEFSSIDINEEDIWVNLQVPNSSNSSTSVDSSSSAVPYKRTKDLSPLSKTSDIPVSNIDGIYQHIVRLEPIVNSKVIGYILPSRKVQIRTTCGSWCKVRIHTTHFSSNQINMDKKLSVWGWCIAIDEVSKFEYLQTKMITDASNAVQTWYEKYDDNGFCYYYNPDTDESKWEAPEWIEEYDDESKSFYYMQLDPYTGNPFKSTWTKPSSYCKLKRG